VVSLLAGRRTKEIGIRMALGAQRGSGLRMVLVNGLSLATVGVVIGMVAALATAPLRSSLLNGVSPRDPLTFVTRRPDSSDRHVCGQLDSSPAGHSRRSQYGPTVRVNTGGLAERVLRVFTLPGPQSQAARDGILCALLDRQLTQARRSGLSLLHIPVFMARTSHCVDGRQCRSRSSLIL
jgi:FtsX-like permease family